MYSEFNQGILGMEAVKITLDVLINLSFSKNRQCATSRYLKTTDQPQNISRKQHFLTSQSICSFIFLVNKWLN
jgi:hypothetical protein